MGGPMMASGHQSEAELENHLIRKLQSIGYHFRMISVFFCA